MVGMTPLAYIDPMSGAILLQVLLAGIIGGIAFFRRSIAALISRMFHRGKSADEQPPEQHAS